MEPKKNNLAGQDSSLCLNCNVFYANPHFNQMCSKCYKEATSNSLAKAVDSGVSVTAPIEPPTAVDQKQAAPVVQTQADKSKCWNCQKKAGVLGFECKCGFVFCKAHRLPENHKCSYDFAVEGKKQLEKLNPVVRSDKLEKF